MKVCHSSELQLREIGLAEAVEILAAHGATLRDRGPFVRGWIDHAASPVADVLTAAAAELAVARVASGIVDGQVGVEPAEAARLAMADGAEASVAGTDAELRARHQAAAFSRAYPVCYQCGLVRHREWICFETS